MIELDLYRLKGDDWRRGDITSGLRLATEADWWEMHRVRMSVRENVLRNPGAVTREDYLDMLRRRGRGWVHEIEGRIVGFSFVDRDRANVWALFVEPGHERRGIGRALHDAMMDWCFNSGAGIIWLGTDPGTRAERFYRAAGWELRGVQPNGEQRFEMSPQRWRAISSTRRLGNETVADL